MPSVIEGTSHELHPEGIAWDPLRNRFILGSVRHGKLVSVDRCGTVRPFADDGVMVSTVGVRVDPARQRVYTPFQDVGVGTRSTPETTGKQSGLGVFDLYTGSLIHRVDLSAVPGGSDGPHGANDAAHDPFGNAYVTDLAAGEVYRVDRFGRPELLIADPDRLGADGAGPNGIVYHPDGYLLVVSYRTGRLWRLDPAAPGLMTEVELEAPAAGSDGMAWTADGGLAVVCNDLDAPGTPSVVVYRSGDGWYSAAAESVRPWPEESPTTAVTTHWGTYVVEGRLAGLLDGSGRLSDEFTIRRL